MTRHLCFSTLTNKTDLMTESNPNKMSLKTGGAIIAGLGVLAAIFPLVTGLTLSLFFGIALIFGAMAHMAQAFSRPSWKGSLWMLALSLIYVFAGITLLINPLLGLTTLTILLVLHLFFSGLVEIIWGFRLRKESYAYGIVFSGLLSIAVGGLIWFQWPSSARWALGLLFGLSLISTGVSMMIYGRKMEKTSED